MNEKYLIEQIKNGRTASFAGLVERYQTPVYNLMLRMTRSETLAFDLAQETFVRAFEKIGTFDSGKNFFPWLYTLGLNLARDHLRSTVQERRRTSSLENAYGDPVELVDPGNPIDEAITREHLDVALARLPVMTREVLIMRFREGFSCQEIADSLDVGLSNAKMKIHRGLEMLRNIMGTEDWYE